MKKNYQQPATTIVHVAMQRMISQSTAIITTISGTPGFTYGGGSNQSARVKEILDGWEEAWNE